MVQGLPLQDKAERHEGDPRDRYFCAKAEEFRYLESVNKLYEVIGELSEYEQNGFQLPRSYAKEHYLNLKRLNPPEAKNVNSSQL